MGQDFYLVSDAYGTMRLGEGDLKIIGRDESSDIVLMDLMVSRRHARIFWDGHVFVLEDLDSRNGTFIGNERVTVQQLSEGLTFRIGPFSFTFREGLPVDDLADSEQAEIMETIAGMPQGLNFSETGFTGDLSTLAIAEVIQTLNQGAKSGVLTIVSDELRAKLYFEDGEIVHARAGILMDRDAIFRVTRLDQGHFEFSDCTEPPARTINEGTMALLLEAFRRADEQGK